MRDKHDRIITRENTGSYRAGQRAAYIRKHCVDWVKENHPEVYERIAQKAERWYPYLVEHKTALEKQQYRNQHMREYRKRKKQERTKP